MKAMTTLHLQKLAHPGAMATHCLSKHSAISDVMGKVADLLDFERGEILMSRRRGTIYQKQRVSTNLKWRMGGETISRQPTVCPLQHISSRGERRLLRVTKELQQPKSPVATTVATQRVFLNT